MTNPATKTLFWRTAVAVMITAAGSWHLPGAAGAGEPAPNKLTDEQRTEGWQLLFDGEKPEDHWRGYRRDDLPDGWRAEDGWLVLANPGAGDIVTRDKFESFELFMEWKLVKQTNSGILYRVQELDKPIWASGPEYQVIDNRPGQNPKHASGSLYDLIGADPGLAKPTGEINTTRIIVKGDYVEHHLNGEKIFGVQLEGEKWEQMVRNSKFQAPPFATERRGHLGLQDHGHWVAYRNIRIRPIEHRNK